MAEKGRKSNGKEHIKNILSRYQKRELKKAIKNLDKYNIKIAFTYKKAAYVGIKAWQYEKHHNAINEEAIISLVVRNIYNVFPDTYILRITALPFGENKIQYHNIQYWRKMKDKHYLTNKDIADRLGIEESNIARIFTEGNDRGLTKWHNAALHIMFEDIDKNGTRCVSVLAHILIEECNMLGLARYKEPVLNQRARLELKRCGYRYYKEDNEWIIKKGE